MAQFTRIQAPLRITYYLETDQRIVFEKEMTPVLDVDMNKLAAWAKEDGISIEREIVQWLTRNFVHSLSSDEKEKAHLHKLALQHKSSLKIGVMLCGDIAYQT